MQLQKCTMKDVAKLALLNKQLIEDEKSDNAMNISELERRMKGFLETDYNAYFFIENSQIIGYALIRNTSNPIYLRQFFIGRDYRRHHYGTQAFQMLLKHLDINETSHYREIDLEVLPWNKNGLEFWKHCGFSETCIAMRYKFPICGQRYPADQNR